MRKIVLVLSDTTSPTTRATLATLATRWRCEAYGGFLSRLDAAALVVRPADAAASLDVLTTACGVVVDGDDRRYVPTRAARDRVAADEDGAWPRAVASRHRKVVRRTPGAIFRFPLDVIDPGSDGADVPAWVETFVTDWTGMPSACAMALHPDHPLGAPLPPGHGAAFTGRFCRHPLTGDLLPIWVADWVKPEFGTGAVILNPAHNRADLDFAREVGLPVRFSLVPDGYDGSPRERVTPPYIRSGVAFRAGAADGLPFDQAGQAHLRTAADRGLAEPWTDAGMGTFRVAASDGTRASAALSAVDEAARAADLTVVCPSSLVDTDLLALRLLLAEPDLDPPVKAAPEVIVVGSVAGDVAIDHGQADAVRLALLVGAATGDTVALKPQQLEQCERFLATHETLAGRSVAPGAGDEASPEVAQAAAQIRARLIQRDPKQAFTQLYRLQKTLAKADAVPHQDLRHYQTLAHTLTATPLP
ncbi:MAG: hypothetical protein ACRD2C_14735 [Acidimicrobiales bacterium]